jgi:glutamate racemase
MISGGASRISARLSSLTERVRQRSPMHAGSALARLKAGRPKHSARLRPRILQGAVRVVSTEARDRARCLDPILASPGGHIRRSGNPGAAVKAADALAADHIKHVLIVIGSNMGRDKEGNLIPTSDGLVGAATLASALAETGTIVSTVADPANKKIVQEALKALGPEMEEMSQYARFVVFDEKDREVAGQRAEEWLKKLDPDAVVEIGVPGRNARSKENRDVTNGNGLDVFLQRAYKKRLVTVHCGDEALEGKSKTPWASGGRKMIDFIRGHYEVSASLSDLAAAGIAAAVLAKSGKLEKMPEGAQQRKMVSTVLGAGAFDSSTGKRRNGMRVGEEVTGLSGKSSRTYSEDVDLLIRLARRIPAQKLDKASVEKLLGYVMVLIDSSNGGLVAMNEVIKYLKWRCPYLVHLIAAVDHLYAPYGDLSREKLFERAAIIMENLEDLGVQAVVAACNTFCLTLPEAQRKLYIPVLHLIAVASAGVAREGGARPTVISTKNTFDSNMYPDLIHSASKGSSVATGIAAPAWAPIVNDLKHLSKDPEVSAQVKESVRERIREVPKDATSIVFGCTHYPALREIVSEVCKEEGLGHVPLIDPIVYQVEAMIELMNSGSMNPVRLDGSRHSVLTSGSVAKVSAAAEILVGPPVTVARGDYGKAFSPEDAKEALGIKIAEP